MYIIFLATNQPINKHSERRRILHIQLDKRTRIFKQMEYKVDTPEDGSLEFRISLSPAALNGKQYFKTEHGMK